MEHLLGDFQIARSGELLSRKVAKASSGTPAHAGTRPLNQAECGSGRKVRRNQQSRTNPEKVVKGEDEDKDLPSILRDIKKQEEEETWEKHKADM